MTTHRAASPYRVSNPAVSRDDRYRNLQTILFGGGAVLMPLGVLIIFLGWYGIAHTRYQYNQMPYLISGGILGLALTFIGGFLYFGAWLAKVAADQKESAQQLSDTILVLADLVSKSTAGSLPNAVTEAIAQPGSIPVLAGQGTTVHRRDCALIAHRDDLRVLAGNETDLTTCRVCQPEWTGSTTVGAF
jgi:hypothetical protein